ncbi:unnamed protein product [Agarophyton chilense]
MDQLNPCRYHLVRVLLDLPDEVILLIFARLCPPTTEFKEAELRETRDALNLSRTCARLEKLFAEMTSIFAKQPRSLNLQHPAPPHALLNVSRAEMDTITFILLQGRRSLRCVRLPALGEAHDEVMAQLYRCDYIRDLQFVDESSSVAVSSRKNQSSPLSLLSFVPWSFGRRLRRLVLLKPTRETIRAFANTWCSPAHLSLFRISPTVMRDTTKEHLPRLLRQATSFSISFFEDLPLEQTHHFVQRLRTSLWAIRRHLPVVRLVDRAGEARFTRLPRVRFVRDEKVRLSEWLTGLDGFQRFPPPSAFDPTMRERMIMEVDTYLAAQSLLQNDIKLCCPPELQIQAADSRTANGKPLFIRNDVEGMAVFAATMNLAKQIGASEVILSTRIASCAGHVLCSFPHDVLVQRLTASRSAGWTQVAESLTVGVVGDFADTLFLRSVPALLRLVRLSGAGTLWIEDVKLHIRGCHIKELLHFIKDAIRETERAELAGLKCTSVKGVLEKWHALCFDESMMFFPA